MKKNVVIRYLYFPPCISESRARRAEMQQRDSGSPSAALRLRACTETSQAICIRIRNPVLFAYNCFVLSRRVYIYIYIYASNRFDELMSNS